MPTPRLTEEDFKRNNWQKLTIDQIKPDDQLYKTLDVKNNDWWVGDAQGNLVPASVVNKWLNGYERQTPYQKQNDIATAREVELAQQHRANQEFNRQMDNFWGFNWVFLNQIGGAALRNLPFTNQIYTGGNGFFNDLLLGTNGIVTDKFASEHPFLSTMANIAFDFSPAYPHIVKSIQTKGINLTNRAIRNYDIKQLANEINKVKPAQQYEFLNTGQIGWAPRQTLTGYHASNKPIQEFDHWYPNWAVTEHNAPHGVYFTANETRPSGGFLAKRPYIEQVTSTFNKPMAQVGEISTAGKNATRNLIERQAQSMGADGIIYQGIKDNQLENQTIVKTLNPDQRVNVSKIIENDPYINISEQRLPYLEFDGKVTREVPPSELYERALSKIPKDLIFETTEPNFILDPTDPEGYYFITKNEMDPAFNKEFGEETLRRLKNLGVDINQPAPYEIGSNTVVISPKKYVTDEVSKRLYLGFDPYHDNYGGFHNPRTNRSYVELTSGIPKASTVFHEQNMHGTEKLIEGAEKYYGIDTKRLYENTLKNMLEGVDLSKYPGSTVDVDKWSEFRASVGEVIRKLHYQLRGKGSIRENVSKFEAGVDKLTTEDLANLFDSLESSYGSFYAAMIRGKKHLTPQIKQLLKYAPEVAAPVIGLEQLDQSTSNQKGGKLIRKAINNKQ